MKIMDEESIFKPYSLVKFPISFSKSINDRDMRNGP